MDNSDNIEYQSDSSEVVDHNNGVGTGADGQRQLRRKRSQSYDLCADQTKMVGSIILQLDDLPFTKRRSWSMSKHVGDLGQESETLTRRKRPIITNIEEQKINENFEVHQESEQCHNHLKKRKAILWQNQSKINTPIHSCMKRVQSLLNETSDESSEFSEEETISSQNLDMSQFHLSDENKDDKNNFKEEFLKSQADMFFKQQMRQMIIYSNRRIIKLDVFKNGISNILERNVEAEIYYDKSDIQRAEAKSHQLIPLYEQQLDKRTRRYQKKLKKAAFDYKQVNEMREKISNIQKQAYRRIQDQKNFIKWVNQIQIQNEGIFNVHEKELLYDRKSLYMFSYQNLIRNSIVWFAEWKWFDRIVVFLILIASICQAASDNLDPDGEDPYNQKIFLIMEITTFCFIFEAIIKIICQGLWMHKNSYLRCWWNKLDFFVVLFSMLEIALKMASFGDTSSGIKGLRALRVIRPLRTVKRIPRLRRLVIIMLRSLPELGNTLIFLMFFFLVFGIIGIQSFQGAIYQRCRLTPTPQQHANGTYYWDVDTDQNFICNQGNDWVYQKNQCGKTAEGHKTYCFSPYSEPWFLDPEIIDDPWTDELISYNAMNYSNLINSIVTCFEALTLEGWTVQMFNLMQSGNSLLSIFYYFLLVIFGSYFIFNLILAVIMGSFTKFENQEIQMKIQEQEELELKTIANSEIENVFKRQSTKQFGKLLDDFTKRQNPRRNNGILRKSSVRKEIIGSLENVTLRRQSRHQINDKNYEDMSNNDLQQNAMNIQQVSENQTPPAKMCQNIGISSSLIKSNSAAQLNSLRSMEKSKPKMRIDEIQEQCKDESKEESKEYDSSLVSNSLVISSLDLESINKNFQSQLKPQKEQEVIQSRNNDETQLNTINGNIIQLVTEIPNDFEISDEEEYKFEYKKDYEGGDDDNVQMTTEFTGNQTDQAESHRKIIKKPRTHFLINKILSSQIPSPLSKKSFNTSSETSKSVVSEIDSEILDMFNLKNEKKEKKISIIEKLKERWADLILISSTKYSKTMLYKFFHHICTNQVFVLIILFCIGINSVTLSIDNFPQERGKAETLEIINHIVTWIFVVELIIKILGLGMHTYVIDPINQFDAIIVTFSIIEMILEASEKSQISEDILDIDTHTVHKLFYVSNQKTLTLFRGFRLFRIFRLARKWKSFHLMMVKIVQSLQDLLTFFILFMIIVFVFALLGNEIFAYRVILDSQQNVVKYPDRDDGQILNLDEYRKQGQSPRPNYDNFANAMVGIFVIMIGEDWQISMHEQIRAQQNRAGPILFFITLYIIGNLFLMNLLLAILLKNFEDGSHSQQENEEEIDHGIVLKTSLDKLNLVINESYQALAIKFRFNKVQRMGPTQEETLFKQQMKIKQSFMNKKHGLVRKSTFGSDENRTKNIIKAVFFKPSKQKYKDSLTTKVSTIDNQTIKTMRSEQNDKNQIEQYEEGKGIVSLSQDFEIISKSKIVKNTDKNIEKEENKLFENDFDEVLEESSILDKDEQKLDKRKFISRIQSKEAIVFDDHDLKIELEGNSLFIFSSENRLRQFLSKIIVHSYFEMFIFICVIFSAILMAFENPLEDPKNYHIQNSLNEIITGIFLIELIMKVIVYGFLFNGLQSYMNIGWNRLDLTIVTISIFSLVSEYFIFEEENNLHLFKMLRVLRSLRMITKNEGLKLSVLSLIYSFPGIVNVGVVSLLCIFLLGIFFLNLLKGRLYHCILPENIEILVGYSRIISKSDCLNYGGIWLNQNVHYDNISSSMFALFVMCTKEGWVTFMFSAVDNVGIGLQPVRDNNLIYQLLFLFFMIFGSMFITNLFIEVVINTFDREKHKIDRNFVLTNFQKEWIQVQLKCFEVNPITKVTSDNKIRKLCIQFVQYEYFDHFIMSIIIMNAVILSLNSTDIDQDFMRYVNFVQDIFTLLFMAECGLKLVAYKKTYFKNPWNIFDFIIVVGGLWDFYKQQTQFISVIRILRVGRVLRLLKKAKNLYQIFNSFLHTIPSFANVGTLIIVMLFIFSTFGMSIFAKVKINGELNEFINFQSFPNAFITLVRCMTGESWYDVMFALSKEKQEDFFCINDPSYKDYMIHGEAVGCGDPNLAYAFFIIFIVSINLVLLNLFIAVVLQGFSDVQSADMCRITDYHINKFINVWSEFDPDGTSFIPVDKIGDLMQALIEAKCEIFSSFNKLGIQNDKAIRQMYCDRLSLKLYCNYTQYNFYDILISISQKFLIYVASQPEELEEIFKEFEKYNEIDIHYLEDVIDNIQDIHQMKNVQFCIQLDRKIIQFKNSVISKLDRFDGNIYTSSMVKIVTFIQREYRKYKRKQILEIQQEQVRSKKKEVEEQLQKALGGMFRLSKIPQAISNQNMTSAITVIQNQIQQNEIFESNVESQRNSNNSGSESNRPNTSIINVLFEASQRFNLNSGINEQPRQINQQL